MRRFAAQYREFFRLPGVAGLVTVALVARMPFGMTGLAMLLYLREVLGSYALAGSVSGAYFVAMAVGSPVQGRLIDRSGPKPTLIVTGFLHPASLIAVLATAWHGAGLPAVISAAVCAGLFVSPANILTRTLWRSRFSSDQDRRRAFAIDSVTIELNLMVGPALVAAVVASVNAASAFGLAIAVTVASVITFIASPALRYLRPEKHGRRHILGPLAEPRLLVVFAATFGLAMSIGFLEIGYPGFATFLAAPALGGIFLSVSSLGSALGGALFGGLTVRTTIERQFAAIATLMIAPLLMHYFVEATAAFALVAFLAGALIAPAVACQSVLVSRLAPSHHATEAFTWSATFIVSGLGAGMAFGGWLIEAAGTKVPFLVGAIVMCAVALVALALRPEKATAS